jgi:ketosteroid isomerase-like protein
MSEDGTIIDRMFGALSRGDVQGAVDCYTPDARVWHGFDRVAHDMAAMRGEWQALIDNFPKRSFVDVRRQSTPSGIVQQHLMVAAMRSGQRKAWPCCIVVRIEDGLIARLDEYIDRAGAFEPPSEGPIVTPGI